MDELQRQVTSLQNKIDVLVKRGRPVVAREQLSIIMMIILIIIGILGGVLAEYLMVELGIKDGQQPWIILAVTIISVLLLFILRRLI